MFSEVLTDMAAIFAQGDGRPQLLRKSNVQQQARQQKSIDHLLGAVDSWRHCGKSERNLRGSTTVTNLITWQEYFSALIS